MKLVNFASLDPAITSTGRSGLKGASKLDREIWAEFHADWEGLISAITATEAEKVYLTHGSTASFGRFLQEEKGIDAVELQTLFGAEEVE